jgi:uracil-DNA glycosylase|tara:strand:- start:580 stop:1248 length:669 start_codon:yes stop_codon:yes gene_type:complete
MNVKLDDSWKNHLNHHINSEQFRNLVDFVNTEYKDNVCYPKGSLIFSALNNCVFDKVKLVILGQDPYHNPNQANGLAFSVPENITHPPSLVNIFKEIQQDLNTSYPANGDLMKWVNQGVLLLNSTLTVRKNNPGSHQNKGWEDFTDEIINIISLKKKNIVFLLWGNYAKKKSKLIDENKHLILSSGHPSPLSANRGYWFGNNHFSKANQYFKENNIVEIKWV